MIEGSSADAIFACSGGKLIPEKPLSLGLTVKSLTGRKTMVSLLNRFDHSAGDETIRRIDLGLEQALFKTKTLVPNHIIRKSNLSTGLADLGTRSTGLSTGLGTILISTSKHHLEPIQYNIHMEFVTRTRCRKNKFKLTKKLPPTYKIHQFQTMEKEKFVASRKHTLQKTLSV